jgi:hypothetical protein
MPKNKFEGMVPPERYEQEIKPEQEVQAKLLELKDALELFQRDLARREIDVQFDGRYIRTSTGNYETRGGEVEGLSSEAVKLLKEKLGITEEKLELIENPNNGQGDLRRDNIKRYKTNVPFLNLEEWEYDEAWHGSSNGVRLVIDHSLGQESTGTNPDLKIDLEKVNELREKKIKDEVNSIVSELEEKLKQAGDKGEFEIPIWEDYSKTRTNTGNYEVRGGGRIGVSEEAEEKLLQELGAQQDKTIDCSDATQVAYKIGSPTRTKRLYTPTKYPNVYIYREDVSGGWHGYSSELKLVKLNKLPPTFEENEENYER